MTGTQGTDVREMERKQKVGLKTKWVESKEKDGYSLCWLHQCS